MNLKERSIEIYEKSDGSRPFEKWYDNLKDEKTQVRINARLDKIASGNFGDVKSVGDGVCELKFSFGPGIRIYFAQTRETIVLLLIGGDKSTQSRDIKKAKEFWMEYKGRSYE